MENRHTGVKGVNHFTLAVRSLDISWQFYVEVLGMKPMARWYKGAYILAGGLWVTLTLDDRTRAAPLPEYSHVAFTVAEEDFPVLERRIRESGASIWQANHSEGASLYFLDPDHHKLEIHRSDLEARWRALKQQAPRDRVIYA